MHTKGLLITDYLFYERTLPYVLATIAVIVVLAIIGKCVSQKIVKRIFLLFFCVYIVGVLSITVFMRESGESMQFEWNVLGAFQRAFQITEGKLHYTTRDNIIELALNITLFVPFGFLLSGIKKTRKWYWNIIAMEMIMSFLIETIQYFLCLGQGELADVINNSLGVVIGVTAHNLLMKRKKTGGEKE